MKVIVGLGNYGSEYSFTRHNVAFMFLDYLVEKYSLSWSSNKKVNAYIAHFLHGRFNLLIAKPITYMNLSGIVVQNILNYYKLTISDLYVVHDDIDLPLAILRTKIGGSSAGHNGIKSIDQNLRSNLYHRIRIGVGRPENKEYPISSYVLGAFSKKEIEELKPLFLTLATNLESYL